MAAVKFQKDPEAQSTETENKTESCQEGNIPVATALKRQY